MSNLELALKELAIGGSAVAICKANLGSKVDGVDCTPEQVSQFKEYMNVDLERVKSLN